LNIIDCGIIAKIAIILKKSSFPDLILIPDSILIPDLIRDLRSGPVGHLAQVSNWNGAGPLKVP